MPKMIVGKGLNIDKKYSETTKRSRGTQQRLLVHVGAWDSIGFVLRFPSCTAYWYNCMKICNSIHGYYKNELPRLDRSRLISMMDSPYPVSYGYQEGEAKKQQSGKIQILPGNGNIFLRLQLRELISASMFELTLWMRNEKDLIHLIKL